MSTPLPRPLAALALLAALLLAALLLAAPAAAQPAQVPEPLRGAWFSGDCADPQAMLVMTGRAAVRVEAEQPARLFRFGETRALAGWTLGVGVGPEAPRLLFRPAPEGVETIEPEAKTRDDRLPGDTPPAVWRRCEAPPLALAALHGEGVAVLAALERMEAGCAGPAAACARAVVEAADVSGDNLLSPAELARLARGAAWLAAAQEGAAAETLAGVMGAGAVGGILAARLLLESLDYDGDGRLSAAELAQDRVGFGRAAGTAEGRPLRLDGLGEGAGMLRALIEGLVGGR